jgi:hypothetical protein
MATTFNPQKRKKSYTEIGRSEFLKKPYEDVWQDRSARECAREASVQPSRTGKSMRAQQTSKNSDHSQKNTSSRNTVQVVAWVRKPRSILINACAAEWGTSRSQATARLIDLGLENKILSANLHLLIEIIEKAIWSACSKFFARLTGILFRMFLINAQILHLQHNLIARSGIQKKLSTESVENIIKWSKAQAQSDVAGRKGQADEALDQAVAAWLARRETSDSRKTAENQSN